MTTERELLNAVFAYSDDPRLLYADWLEENAGKLQNRDAQSMREQAELIKLQIKLERDRDARNDPECLQRETQLIQTRIAALGPEIAGNIKSEPHRISFSRGFIQNLDLEGIPITRLPAGLQVSGNLNLYRTRIIHLPEDLRVGERLLLGGTPITFDDARHILEMSGLSDKAKISGLRTAGFERLVKNVERNATSPYGGR